MLINALHIVASIHYQPLTFKRHARPNSWESLIELLNTNLKIEEYLDHFLPLHLPPVELRRDLLL